MSDSLQNLTFPTSFFEDEVRDGFFISCMMKRYWAAQLTILARIDHICRKYGLRWYADNGTLLGAVRHGGYIPWDDDLDICMLREDWVKFFEVAADELPEDYCVLCLSREPEYHQIIGRVVNSHAIDYREVHLNEFCGCPYTVGVDIFPLDGISGDDEKEEERCRRIDKISRAIEILKTDKTDKSCLNALIGDIEQDNHVRIGTNGDLHHDLLLLMEKLFMACPSKDAEYVSLMPCWVINHDHKYPKSLFDKTLWVPFEHIYMPVPARFDEVLTIEFGNYLTYEKDSGGHDYPVYKDQERILREHTGTNPFRFTLPRNTILSSKSYLSLSERCLEMMKTLNKAHRKLSSVAGIGDNNAFVQILQGCQSLAVDLGTTIENRLPGNEDIVKILEEYCEEVYQTANMGWLDERRDKLDDLIHNVRLSLCRVFFNRKKEVLFLPCKPEWWKSMEPLWRKCCDTQDMEVYVMPVPYTLDNRYGESDDEAGFSRRYPEELKLVSPDEYDIAKRHPDMIYIQFPFDDFTTISQIPERYYSRNLVQHTDELLYVPYFDVNDLRTSYKAREALKVLIEQPAVVYADKVLLQSHSMRQFYVRHLWVLSGNGQYWIDKTEVPDVFDGDLLLERKAEKRRYPSSWKVDPDKKLLLFQITAPFILVNNEAAVAKVRSCLELMLDEFDNFLCIFSPHESLDGIVLEDSEAGEFYRQIIDMVRNDSRIIFDEDHQVGRYIYGIDAYYGNESMLASRFVQTGKPVMIMNCVL